MASITITYYVVIDSTSFIIVKIRFAFVIKATYFTAFIVTFKLLFLPM